MKFLVFPAFALLVASASLANTYIYNCTWKPSPAEPAMDFEFRATQVGNSVVLSGTLALDSLTKGLSIQVLRATTLKFELKKKMGHSALQGLAAAWDLFQVGDPIEFSNGIDSQTHCVVKVAAQE